MKLLATYYAASEEGKEMVFDTLKDWLSADGVRFKIDILSSSSTKKCMIYLFLLSQ